MENVNLKNVGVLGDFTNWTLERNPNTFYPDPYKGIELLSPYIKAVSAKSETFSSSGEETTTDYKKMFKILQKHSLRICWSEFSEIPLGEIKVFS